MRKSKVDWEKLKEELVQWKYVEGKSLTDINKLVYEKYGFAYTNARYSQMFTQWRRERDEALKEEIIADAN
jgi:hypothetical protein